MDLAESDARDVELRWALRQALDDYVNATGSEKDKAKTRYLEVLRRFADRAIAESGKW